jgi:hypothetical protein
MVYYRLPPIRAFPHSIIYQQKTGEDDYQKAEYADTTINNVWFNLSSTFSRGGNNSSDKAPNASITMFYRYSGELSGFENDSLVVFQGKEYKIILVKELVLNGESIGWRLEVV